MSECESSGDRGADLLRSLRRVEAAARSGAQTVTRIKQIVEDAIEQTRQAWIAKLMARSVVHDEGAWAFRVGVNAAKQLGAATARAPVSDHDFSADDLSASTWGDSPAIVNPNASRVLRARLATASNSLTPKQRLVALKLSEEGMTLHRAARELGMDRSNLRRVFARALGRLERSRKDPPLPP